MKTHKNQVWILGFLIAGLLMSGCAAAVVGAAGAGTVAAVTVADDERSLGTMVDDNVIESAVKNRLKTDRALTGFDVSVHSYQGHVYLVGYKANEIQKDLAFDLTRSVKGVRSVDAYLIYKGTGGLEQYAGDSLITAKVKAELINDPGIKSTQIDVETITGHVVLLGIVTDSRMIGKAIADARRVNGTRPVVSFLTAP